MQRCIMALFGGFWHGQGTGDWEPAPEHPADIMDKFAGALGKSGAGGSSSSDYWRLRGALPPAVAAAEAEAGMLSRGQDCHHDMLYGEITTVDCHHSSRLPYMEIPCIRQSGVKHNGSAALILPVGKLAHELASSAFEGLASHVRSFPPPAARWRPYCTTLPIQPPACHARSCRVLWLR